MAGCRTDIDWAARPYPWNEIGPAFRAECAADPGGRIRARRKALGLSQKALGEAAGYSGGDSIVSQLERNSTGPVPRARIEAALDRLERDSEVTRVTSSATATASAVGALPAPADG